jgi:hypothetical protein
MTLIDNSTLRDWCLKKVITDAYNHGIAQGDDDVHVKLVIKTMLEQGVIAKLANEYYNTMSKRVMN